MLNDITFDAFHMFRADSHMLPGFNRHLRGNLLVRSPRKHQPHPRHSGER